MNKFSTAASPRASDRGCGRSCIDFFDRRCLLIGLMVVSIAGCPAAQPPKEAQRAAQKEVNHSLDNEATLRIEIIGTYRNGDAEYVREQIEAILPDGIRNYSWEWGGNQCAYEIPAVANVDALARQIQFGKVIHVDPALIRVQYAYDHEVPARFKEDASDWHEPPEDELGPALKKHQGDWWAALGDLHATRQENEEGEIIRLGAELGVDYALTVSCYQATADGLACGKCDSCRLRRQGFIDAGVKDPTRYLST